MEVDARVVPWSTVRRLALTAGQFPPLYQPVSEEELARIWPERYAHRTGVLHWQTCSCNQHPAFFRFDARTLWAYQEQGDVLKGEAGLGWPAGGDLSLEPSFDVSSGSWWAAVSTRFQGRGFRGGSQELFWPGWSPATGNFQVDRARSRGGAWRLDWPRLVTGFRWRSWNVTAGWMPAKTGPGMTGALTLGRTAPSFPALVLRRSRAFAWSGLMKPLAPDHFLLRVGRLSRRDVFFKNEYGTQHQRSSPWFFQWLLGWEPTGWFRTTFTQTTMATAWQGTLWPDLLQINFPLMGTTWREADSGPVTDRIFSAQFEFRWRRAPWPVLPSLAGRLYWDYSGTDFLPSGPGGVIPELSIPASVAGVELIGSRWDLAGEYFGLYHPNALWYSNGGYPEGYTQEQWLLGHPAGGGARGFSVAGKLRPGGTDWEFGLKVWHTSWKHEKFFPGQGRRTSMALSAERWPYQWTTEWVREENQPSAEPRERRNWWRCLLTLNY